MTGGGKRRLGAVVVGCSAGGFYALSAMLGPLPSGFGAPVLVAQHLHPSDDGAFAMHLGRVVSLAVCEPCDKECLKSGRVYVAPANYHLLVERDLSVALSTDERVNWSRPSVDVLFLSAARVWGGSLAAVILSGANNDGARGMKAVKAAGGLTIAQDPAEAEFAEMPLAAIGAGVVDMVLGAGEIGRHLAAMA